MKQLITLNLRVEELINDNGYDSEMFTTWTDNGGYSMRKLFYQFKRWLNSGYDSFYVIGFCNLSKVLQEKQVYGLENRCEINSGLYFAPCMESDHFMNAEPVRIWSFIDMIHMLEGETNLSDDDLSAIRYTVNMYGQINIYKENK